MSDVTLPQQVTAEQKYSIFPMLTVESLDKSIPLGESFPVAIDITNAAPNDEFELEIEGGGVIPSVTKAGVTTDSAGRAQVRLSARAAQPALDALHVVAYGSSGHTLTGTLYTNFETPYVEGAELQTQSSKPMGEPLTIDEYYDTLPVAKTEADIEAFNEDPSPPKAYILDGVQFKNVDGKLEQKFDAVVLDSGTENIDTASAQSQPSLTAQACTTKSTYVTLKTVIDQRPADHIKGTRVRINTGTGPMQVRYVGDNGRTTFDYSCSTKVSFEVDAWTNTGIYMHTAQALLTEKLFVWKGSVAAGGKVFTADNIRGTVVRTDGDTLSIDSQRLFWKINQVYDWERKSHSLYDTFPLDIFYPYIGVGGLSGVGRTNIPGAGARQDRLIFHEFGHEVYYRRMLGGAEYNRLHQDVTLRGKTPAYPACLDALGWKTWAIEGPCAGMLEGFALWFQSVSTRALNAEIDTSFDVELTPASDTRTAGTQRPGSVAQFLLDLTDSHSSGVLLNYEPPAIDPVKPSSSDIRARYQNVAQFFRNGPIESDFSSVWKNMFKPRLTKAQLINYCVVKKHNMGTWAGDGC